MTKTYRPWSPEQAFLLPPSPTEWLPEGHLAYFILETVQTLDLGAIEAAIAAKDPRGERPYSPRMLVALLLYGYCVGVFSSRKIARATYEDVAFRVLAGGSHPHFTTVNTFRLTHLEALHGLFLQILRLCQRAGLVKLGHVSLDGTKILANASKHKAMSYKRMTEDEARLTAEIEKLFARADEADRTEDERYGVGEAPEDLPAELRRREARLAAIQAAKADLEREAKEARAEELRANARAQEEKAADESVDPVERLRAGTRAKKSEAEARTLSGRDDEPPPSADAPTLPRHRIPHDTDGNPTPGAQRNFTDPDSRIMVRGGEFVQAYNAQTVVDETAQIIVAEAVSNQAPDSEYLPPLLDAAIANTGDNPERFSADSGYFGESNVACCEQRGVDPYIAVGRKRHAAVAEATQGRPGNPIKERMRSKLATPEGHKIYARRKVIAEPPFGQIKQARGFRRFSFRGVRKVRCEWSFVCATHNLLKLFRSIVTGPLPELA